ncbi:hypothetical protein ACFE04_029377 [Oxalis oulophora]
MAGVKRRMYTSDSDVHDFHKELDEISCPICMEHPHNPVLLLCTSHGKGCRSYICDTSYRHSNCLDRYKKINPDCTNAPNLPVNPSPTDPGRPIGFLEEPIVNNMNGNSETEPEPGLSLKCPMCRGDVLGWKVVEEARTYLNMKKRSCSRESCSFIGNYQDLRRHARRAHPSTRPSETDPSRERAWQTLENQRAYGDVVSAIRSSMPGAVVVGDYVIENGDRLGNGVGENNGPWLTTFLFQMIGSMESGSEPRSRSRAWSRHRQSSRAALPERRLLWGENLLGLQDDEDDDDNAHVVTDMGEDSSSIPRRRRRLTRSRSDEDQS